MKQCRVCGKKKEETDFYKTGRKKSTNPEERHSECKCCAKARVKARHHANPDIARNGHLQRTYGISLAQFESMILQQDSKCAICECTEPGGKHNQWCVDHDHITGAIRQLLCKDCNIVLGLVQESPEHLERMISYIIKHKASTIG